MKYEIGKEYLNGIQGTSANVNIDISAKSDDETDTILERTLTYAVNTANLDWRLATIASLKEQVLEFKIDAEKIGTMKSKADNLSVELVIEVNKGGV